jgi:CheY-like chemotaxis protein
MLLSGEINTLLMVLGPDDAGADRAPELPPGTPRRLSGPILIVEDDPDIRETLAEILEYEGHAVVAAASGEEALERLVGGLQPGVVLLDLMMPGVNGWGLAGRIRQIPALLEVPIVVVSGVHDLEQQATKLGAAGCLNKPVEVERLLALVHRFSR